MNESARPKIEVVRLPSTERAKISTLVDGGVQIKAEFQHHLTGNYASCSHLEDTNKNCCRFQRHVTPYRKPHFRGNAAQLATKSCDNIFARQNVCASVGQLVCDNSFVWTDSTRSEEYLYRSSSCNQSPVLQTSPRNTRSRILAFLKKLSPLPRRSKTPTEYNPFPWVLVEFSQKNFDDNEDPSKRNSSDSAASDHSFILAVKESELRKGQALPKTRKYIKNNSSKCTTTSPPQIYIASPATSCNISPVSLVTSMPSIRFQDIPVRTTRQHARGKMLF